MFEFVSNLMDSLNTGSVIDEHTVIPTPVNPSEFDFGEDSAKRRFLDSNRQVTDARHLVRDDSQHRLSTIAAVVGSDAG